MVPDVFPTMENPSGMVPDVFPTTENPSGMTPDVFPTTENPSGMAPDAFPTPENPSGMAPDAFPTPENSSGAVPDVFPALIISRLRRICKKRAKQVGWTGRERGTYRMRNERRSKSSNSTIRDSLGPGKNEPIYGLYKRKNRLASGAIVTVAVMSPLLRETASTGTPQEFVEPRTVIACRP